MEILGLIIIVVGVSSLWGFHLLELDIEDLKAQRNELERENLDLTMRLNNLIADMEV